MYLAFAKSSNTNQISLMLFLHQSWPAVTYVFPRLASVGLKGGPIPVFQIDPIRVRYLAFFFISIPIL